MVDICTPPPIKLIKRATARKSLQIKYSQVISAYAWYQPMCLQNCSAGYLQGYFKHFAKMKIEKLIFKVFTWFICAVNTVTVVIIHPVIGNNLRAIQAPKLLCRSIERLDCTV